MKSKYVIIGAGPTGLGAANRLREQGEESFTVLERHNHVGGLAASFKDDAGFTWDIGGHVIFSHYEYFDTLLDELLAGDQLEHERESWIRTSGTWVPYPFQNNIRHLPKEVRWKCIQALLPEKRSSQEPNNFHEWIEHVFGKGIADTFLLPYNYKVWATPPQLMQHSWVGERVSVVNLEQVLETLVLEKDDVGWGPNNTFTFPLHGGTGEIFRRLARKVNDHIHRGQEVISVDCDKKAVTTAQGMEVEYEFLLNTAPLDQLAAQWLVQKDDIMINAAEDFTRNGVYVAGIGLNTQDHETNSRCWMYFPEDDSPFYRVTNFHNYSPNNVAHPGTQLAFMCESSFSSHKEENLDELMDRTIQGLVNTTLLEKSRVHDLVSTWDITVDYGYPVPCLNRDAALGAIQPRLEEKNIFSRGRFGGWKYEVANMDHSVMQGVEWADRMLKGEPETTYSWD